MQIIQAIFLGIIQGLTEFIPISSSGHLVLAEQLFHLQVSGFIFDAMLNFGTLTALIIYFRKDIWEMFLGLFRGGHERRLALFVILATIPGVIGGLLLQDIAETKLRSPYVVSIMLVAVALVMFAVERYARHIRPLEKITAKDSILIGLAQVVAFIPGTSRSGITISAGMARDLKREAAARFSFLMSIPILAGGALKVLFDNGVMQQVSQNLGTFVIGILAALISGYIAIAFLLNYLRKHSLDVFAWYRIGLAIVVVVVTLIR
jgi:undecaprenyl-diphosphatase